MSCRIQLNLRIPRRAEKVITEEGFSTHDFSHANHTTNHPSEYFMTPYVSIDNSLFRLTADLETSSPNGIVLIPSSKIYCYPFSRVIP